MVLALVLAVVRMRGRYDAAAAAGRCGCLRQEEAEKNPQHSNTNITNKPLAAPDNHNFAAATPQALNIPAPTEDEIVAFESECNHTGMASVFHRQADRVCVRSREYLVCRQRRRVARRRWCAP